MRSKWSGTFNIENLSPVVIKKNTLIPRYKTNVDIVYLVIIESFSAAPVIMGSFFKQDQ